MYGIGRDELLHIVVSMVVVSIAFSVGYLFYSKEAFITIFPIILVAVGSGFVLHEMAHKFVAQRYGAYAQYQIWETGLALALLMAVFTGGAFVFAAPGAVYIYAPYISRKQNGMISIAGPFTNLVVGLIFLMILLLSPGPYFALMATTGASINFFLGLFNMIPIAPLDGSKIIGWSFPAWVALSAILGVLVFVH